MNSEHFSLYHFHPIFEFFLTFYTAYLISDDLKKILSKKFFGIVKDKFSEIISKKKLFVISKIEQTIFKLNDDFNGGTPEFNAKKKEKIKEINSIKDEVTNYYNDSNNKRGIIVDCSTVKSIKVYFIFYSLYCFTMLIICGFIEYSELSKPSIYPAIIVFNSISGICTLAITMINKLRRTELSENIGIIVFAILLILSIFCYYSLSIYKLLQGHKHLEICVASFSVLLAASPLIILVLTSKSISKDTLSTIADNKNNWFLSRIKIKDEEVRGYNASIKNFNDALLKLEEAKKAAELK